METCPQSLRSISQVLGYKRCMHGPRSRPFGKSYLREFGRSCSDRTAWAVYVTLSQVIQTHYRLAIDVEPGRHRFFWNCNRSGSRLWRRCIRYRFESLRDFCQNCVVSFEFELKFCNMLFLLLDAGNQAANVNVCCLSEQP